MGEQGFAHYPQTLVVYTSFGCKDEEKYIILKVMANNVPKGGQ